MTLFKTTSGYVYAFLGFVLALFFAVRSSPHVQPTYHSNNFLHYFPKLLGAPFCVFLILRLVKTTSSLIERIVLALCAVFFALFFIQVLHECGYVWVVIPRHRVLVICITALAGGLAGVRLIQVISERHLSGR